ncbi:phage minor head protein [Exiguobacterium sp. R-39]|uniref:phage minor head protein n=1 Tax=Exiguobacterium sp. R-39 TaxID=3416708 RepID=UPI003CEC39B4
MNWQNFMDLIYKELTRRERNTLRKIRREYEAITTALIKEIGAVFSKIEDGNLSYTDIISFRKMQRIQQQAVAQANRLGQFNREAIQQLMDDSYGLSYSWMSFGIERAIDKTLEKATPRTPELLALTRKNQVEKLRLTASLEKSREKITAGIQAAISTGLMQGQNYQQIAKEIETVFTMDYNRASMIAETEVHRIREQGTFDSAQNASTQGIEMVKFWVNMGDEKVRKTRKANHRVLHGQKRALYQPFDLGNDVKAMMPGNSGTPYNDIRCRCIARYEVAGIKSVGVADGETAVKAQFKRWEQSKAS